MTLEYLNVALGINAAFKPPVVCFCGSTKLKDEFIKQNLENRLCTLDKQTRSVFGAFIK